ncbi:hypothetical protein BD779DRAFT_1499672 [Infundibulicybe gibba]|nr:hypothetical protein BD779DRAFT_1499672 [Infundibulicybe gibba]
MASLPPPTKDQAYCDVSALEAGLIELPFEMFITDAPPGVIVAPSLSFLLKHSSSQKLFIFDLGIRRDWENYPPLRSSGSNKYTKFSLAQGGTSPDDVSTICLSHCHFDHIGDTKPFTKGRFVSSYPQDPGSPFSSDLLPPERTQYLDPSGWQPLGPFPRAFDFHGDGSLYIIDSPGKSDIAVGHPGHVDACAHANKEQAEAHILRIRELMKIPRIHVLLAHDEPWYSANKGGSAFWPGQIPSL